MTELSGAKPLVIICVRDRIRSAQFYRNVLGLRLLKDDAFAAVFEVGSAELRLSELKDWKAHGHTVFGFGVDDIRKAVARLSAMGVSFCRFEGMKQDSEGIWAAPDQSARVAWFKDPDGNLLSLTQF